MLAIPAFPGAQKSAVTRGLCASFQTSACSRPPPPTIKTFMLHDSYEKFSGRTEGFLRHTQDVQKRHPARPQRERRRDIQCPCVEGSERRENAAGAFFNVPNGGNGACRS